MKRSETSSLVTIISLSNSDAAYGSLSSNETKVGVTIENQIISECNNIHDEPEETNSNEEEIQEQQIEEVTQVKVEKKKRPSLTKEERLEKKKKKWDEVKKKSGELVASLVLKSLKKKIKKEQTWKTKKTSPNTKKENVEEIKKHKENIEENVEYQAETDNEELGGPSSGGDHCSTEEDKRPLWQILMEKMEREIALFNEMESREINESSPNETTTPNESICSSQEIEEPPKKKKSATRPKPRKSQKRTLKTAKPPPKRKLITTDIHTNEDYEKNKKRTKQTKISSFFQNTHTSSQ